jgi:Uma2 family endonuclease
MLWGMSQAARRPHMSFGEYVALEQAGERKHEFLDGNVWAMAGGTPEHAQLALNIGAELRAGMLGGCRVFSADLRVRVRETGLSTYPDVTVVCGPLERDPEDPNTVTNPTVIVEVLSDSTEAYDRGEKFSHYRRIASLQAYVLVSQRGARIEVFRPNPDGSWTLEDAELGADAKVGGLCTLSVDAVYRDVELPPPPPRPEG